MSRLVVLLSTVLLAEGMALAKPCPNIMLVLDESGSMAMDVDGNDPLSSGQDSKWKLLQEAIGDVVQSYGENVPFGMELYTIGAIRVGDDVCYNETSITVPLSHDSTKVIQETLKASMPKDDTNTNGAIRRARLDPALHDTMPDKNNFIILVTDGNPNCGTDLTASDLMTHYIDSSQPGTSADEIRQAAAQVPRVLTYVVGFDGDKGVNPQNLDDMAFYGLGPGNHPCGHEGEPHCYFTAGKNFQEFKMVLENLISQTCGGEFGCGICDDSCAESGCPVGQICTSTETQPSRHCEPDLCNGMSCDKNFFCRSGACVKACDQGCHDDETCVDGSCVKDLCKGVSCSASQACDPKNGTCVDFPCPDCVNGAACDIATGRCVTDYCKTGQVNCPKGMTCVWNGNCVAPLGGVSGCSFATPRPSFDPGIAVAGALLLLSFGMLLRRRSARQ